MCCGVVQQTVNSMGSSGTGEPEAGPFARADSRLGRASPSASAALFHFFSIGCQGGSMPGRCSPFRAHPSPASLSICVLGLRPCSGCGGQLGGWLTHLHGKQQTGTKSSMLVWWSAPFRHWLESWPCAQLQSLCGLSWSVVGNLTV